MYVTQNNKPMKQRLLLFALLFAAVVVKAQTVVVLELPDPCPTQVEENFIVRSGLTVTPNPVVDELTLQFDDKECSGLYDIVISDVKGLTVLKVNSIADPSQLMRLNVSHLPAGLYFLNVKTEKSTFAHKIIKM